MRLVRDRIKGFFLPVFSELSLFMMGVAFVLVFFFNETLRSKIYKWMNASDDILTNIILLVFFGGGLVLSVYHVFAEREKNINEKYAMLFFAVMSNAVCGIFASMHILKQSSDAPSILILLPIWNIINCALLVISFRFGIINESNISDENATGFEVLFGFFIIMSAFLVCQFMFKLYWAITFSICVIYATSFSDALGSVFGPERQSIAKQDIVVNRNVNMAGKSEKCGLCERLITSFETPYVINRKLVVCKECHDQIQSNK